MFSRRGKIKNVMLVGPYEQPILTKTPVDPDLRADQKATDFRNASRILERGLFKCRQSERNCKPLVTTAPKGFGGSSIGQAIIKTANEVHADRIVMGARSTSALPGFNLGSVSKTVATESPQEVTIARNHVELDPVLLLHCCVE